MAREPRVPLTAEEIASERSRYRERYFILVQAGAVMILMSSISPFFAANQIPAGFILGMSIAYDRWSSATRGQKRLLAYGSLLCVFFIGFNALLKWYLPPALGEDVPALMPTFISAEQTITLGYIGHWIAMFGVFQALAEIRLMPKDVELADEGGQES